MKREVVVRVAAQRALKRLDATARDRVVAAARSLGEDPFTARPGMDIRRLKGEFEREDLYRLRVGSHRVFYAVGDDTVTLVDVRKRDAAY